MALRRPAQRTVPPFGPLTAEEFFALPDTPGERYELYDGMLLIAPPPSLSHQNHAGLVYMALFAEAERLGGFAFIAPVGVTLSAQIVFEPDVGFVSAERGRILNETAIDGAPDIVVEVLSPSTRRYDQHTKLPAYLEHGVREVWLVDPQRREVAVHTSEGTERAPFGKSIPSSIVDVGAARLGDQE